MTALRLWYMDLGPDDLQAVSVVCWLVVAVAMGWLMVLLLGER